MKHPCSMDLISIKQKQNKTNKQPCFIDREIPVLRSNQGFQVQNLTIPGYNI
jgi:hypothetical protein